MEDQRCQEPTCPEPQPAWMPFWPPFQGMEPLTSDGCWGQESTLTLPDLGHLFRLESDLLSAGPRRAVHCLRRP